MMKVMALLADWAEEIKGKLYIQGGGWSRLTLVRPANFTLALKIYVPWDQANRRHTIAAYLLNEDGDPVVASDTEPGHEVRLSGHFEVGRPPGLKPGSDIDAPLVMRVQGLDLAAGRYYWVIEIDGDEAERIAFDILRPSAPQR